MLYPTYLSSFTHLLKSDIRPISLLSVLRGDSSRSFFSTKPVIEPPPAKSVIKPAKSVIKPATTPVTTPVTTPATARPATKPISITDRHSRAGTSCPVAAI